MKELYEGDADGRIDFLIMNCVCVSASNRVLTVSAHGDILLLLKHIGLHHHE